MTAVAFDTLKLARKLRDTAHMSQEQAEGIADALAEAMSGAELATKADITSLKNEIKSDLTSLKNEIKSDVADIKGKIKSDIADVKTDIANAKTDVFKSVMALIIGAVVLNSVVVLGSMFGLAKLLGH
jgi:gas vesicle protein